MAYRIFFDSGSIALIIELLFVTSCVSTILYILTKKSICFLFVFRTNIVYSVRVVSLFNTFNFASINNDDTSIDFTNY